MRGIPGYERLPARLRGRGVIVERFYHDEPLNYPQACYAVFARIFFESTISFPTAWYLELLFLTFAIVGLAAIAGLLVRLGYLAFTTKQKVQEWQIMQAAVMRDHIVVIGVGKVGYRIIKGLLPPREDVVAVERKRDSPLVSEVLDMGVPVSLYRRAFGERYSPTSSVIVTGSRPRARSVSISSPRITAVVVRLRGLSMCRTMIAPLTAPASA